MLFQSLRNLAFGIVFATCLQGANAASAQSPTQNASNSAEYNTYVYTACARSMVLNLPTTIENQYNATTSSGLRAQLNSEKFFAELLNIHVERAFDHAYLALVNNDDSQWGPCLQDLNAAIFACDDLLNFQSGMTNPSTSRRQAVQSCKFYLEVAADNCFELGWVAWFRQPILVRRP